MTEEQYIDIKDAYVEHIGHLIKKHGELLPHVTIFADQLHPDEEDEGKPAVIHIQIPDEFMKNDSTKDKFIYDFMPEIFTDIKKEFKPYGIAWASEAWMRIAKKEELDTYKNLPKKEVIMISISTSEKDELIIYEMLRRGKQVNADGEFTDVIVLNKMPDMSKDLMDGRLVNLFKKFDKN